MKTVKRQAIEPHFPSEAQVPHSAGRRGEAVGVAVQACRKEGRARGRRREAEEETVAVSVYWYWYQAFLLLLQHQAEAEAFPFPFPCLFRR